MKCTAALAGVLALAMLLTGCKKPVDTVAATAETAESAATDETAATPCVVQTSAHQTRWRRCQPR